MEALAAVGLAANVLQFIQFGCELFSLTAEIRKSREGHAISHKDLEIIAKDLQTHIEALKPRGSSATVQKFADEARKTAEKLLYVIYDIRKKGSNSGSNRHGKWSSFRQALETIMKKSQVESLAMRLDSLRDQLQFDFITETRDAQDQIVKTLANLASSSAALEYKLSCELEETSKTLKTVHAHLTNTEISTSQSTLHNVLREFCFQEFGNTVKSYTLLHSLTFPTMTVRHDAIAQAHKRTYEWIFKTETLSAKDRRSKIHFSSWLQSGSGIYWITGKPGAGKSTLMKFIENHDTTFNLLEEWADPLPVVFASFYFWSTGAVMQKSLQGLLQSLLHKVLSSCPKLIPIVCSKRWASNIGLPGTPWSLSELENAFMILSTQKTLERRFYFHIDGLDEYEGDYDKVIGIIESLSQTPTFKICVSSRPWNEFQDTIGRLSNGCLQLHLFTKKDIELYARESVLNQRKDILTHVQRRKYDDIVHEIAERAQGVFLWVRLVVRSLRDGIVNGDQINFLRKRLEKLPTDLETFFEHILSSVDELYHERMARAFLTALASPEPLKLIHYSLLDEEDPYFGWRILDYVGMDGVTKGTEDTIRRLNGRYKGLLEPAKDSVDPNVTVDFLHRTFGDFLRTPKMTRMLESQAPESFDPQYSAVGAFLGEAKLLEPSLYPSKFKAAADFARSIWSKTDSSLLEFRLFDHIEIVLQHPEPQWSHMPEFPTFMLRAAVHGRQDDYIRHRINSSQLPLDLNWILVHLCCHSRSVASLDDMFESDLHPSQWYRCDCNFERIIDDAGFNVELVETLLAKGADPNARVGGINILEKFLRLMNKAHSLPEESYHRCWDVLELMVLYGAAINDHLTLLSRVALEPHSSGSGSTKRLLEGLSFLLKQGVDPNADIWVGLLHGLYGQRLNSELQGLLRNLISSFLCRGADVTRLFTTSKAQIYCVTSWFQRLLSDITQSRTAFCGMEVDELFEVFLQHGLNPNYRVDEMTIWEHLLRAFGEAENHQRHVELMLLLLQYRADPYSERLYQLLGWRAGYKCQIAKPYASKFSAAVLLEQEDLRRRQEESPER